MRVLVGDHHAKGKRRLVHRCIDAVVLFDAQPIDTHQDADLFHRQLAKQLTGDRLIDVMHGDLELPGQVRKAVDEVRNEV